MILKRNLTDITATETRRYFFFDRIIVKEWKIDPSWHHLVNAPNNRTFARLKYGENTLVGDKRTYEFNFPERSEELAPFITFEVQFFLDNHEITEVVEIFNGPEDLAMLWKLSI